MPGIPQGVMGGSEGREGEGDPSKKEKKESFETRGCVLKERFCWRWQEYAKSSYTPPLPHTHTHKQRSCHRRILHQGYDPESHDLSTAIGMGKKKHVDIGGGFKIPGKIPLRMCRITGSGIPDGRNTSATRPSKESLRIAGENSQETSQNVSIDCKKERKEESRLNPD